MALMSLPPGMKIAAQITPEPAQADLDFIRQMGVDYVVLWTGGDKAGYEYYSSRKQLFEAAGLKVYGFGSFSGIIPEKWGDKK